jgi:dTDP-4-amino-4,6-dideoxygalactose transaminase
MCTFSFHPVKSITTGEGGAVTTNNRELYDRLLSLRAHGIHKNEEQFVNVDLAFDEEGNKNSWYYEMPEVGFNYRLTDIQCALGSSQLRKLDFFISRRRSIAKYYTEEFEENQFITTPIERSDTKHAYHLYVILVDFKRLGKSRNGVMKELRELGIGTQVLYIPVHLQPYYKEKYSTNFGDCPISEGYYESCVSIPMFPSLQDDEMKFIAECMNAVIS